MEQFHMFSIGCLIGLIFSYTGVSIFISGVISGVILQSSYPSIGKNIEHTVWLFTNFIRFYIDKSSESTTDDCKED